MKATSHNVYRLARNLLEPGMLPSDARIESYVAAIGIYEEGTREGPGRVQGPKL